MSAEYKSDGLPDPDRHADAATQAQPPSLSPSEIVQQARDFDALVRRVYGPLVKYFARRGLISADCEDLAQLVLIRVLGKMRAAPGEVTDGYVFVAANSVFVDHCRHTRSRKASYSVELDPELADDQVLAEKILEDRQTLDVIMSVVRHMKPKQRRAFELHRFEHLSYGQIAKRMEASVSSVEKYVMAALGDLRRALEGMKHG